MSIVRTVLICIACFVSIINAYADFKGYEEYPYSELFTEGKEWTLYHFGSCPGPDKQTYYTNHIIIFVKVDGEKIIEGIPCKRLTIDICPCTGSCSACMNWVDRDIASYMYQDIYDFKVGIPEEVFVYEKDRKIYFYRNPGLKLVPGDDVLDKVVECDPYFELLMDLNVSIGDIAAGVGTIDSDELININGKYHRKLSGHYAESYPIPEWKEGEWIEGIGATIGLSMYFPYYEYFPIQLTDMTSPHFVLAHVKENGITLFDQTPLLLRLGLDVPTSVDQIIKNCSSSDTYFDLLGRPINKPKQGELVIHNGKVIRHLHK